MVSSILDLADQGVIAKKVEVHFGSQGRGVDQVSSTGGGWKCFFEQRHCCREGQCGFFGRRQVVVFYRGQKYIAESQFVSRPTGLVKDEDRLYPSRGRWPVIYESVSQGVCWIGLQFWVDYSSQSCWGFFPFRRKVLQGYWSHSRHPCSCHHLVRSWDARQHVSSFYGVTLLKSS